jgi:hypothetical protein
MFYCIQKVMWKITFYCISEGHVEYYVLLYFRRSCWILCFTVFQKVVLNITFYCISEGHVEYCVLLYFRRSCGILIGYYTVVCTIWKYIVRVCIVLKTRICIVLKTRIGRDAAGFSIQYGRVQYISILYIPLYNNLFIIQLKWSILFYV